MGHWLISRGVEVIYEQFMEFQSIQNLVNRRMQVYDNNSLKESQNLLGNLLADYLSLRINLPLFSTVVPAVIFVLLSCRPFVAITTLSTGFVGVEITCNNLCNN